MLVTINSGTEVDIEVGMYVFFVNGVFTKEYDDKPFAVIGFEDMGGGVHFPIYLDTINNDEGYVVDPQDIRLVGKVVAE